MRRVFLAGSLFVLVALTCVIWALRFKRVEGLSDWYLADLRSFTPPTEGVEWAGSPDDPVLRLTMKQGKPPLAIRLAIPDMVPVEGLHLRFRLSSRQLESGPQRWQTGRFMIEWDSVEGQREVHQDSAGSSKGDGRGALESFVIQAPAGSWLPVLRLEHLGRYGDFELSELEITAVEESPTWRVGWCFLVIGWLAWVAACVRCWPCISWRRATAAASIWVVLGINFVIPGPWKVQRPIVSEFHLGPKSGEIVTKPQEIAAIERVNEARPIATGATSALGEMPDQGSFPLRLKHAISRARPLLHAALLFAPTMVFLMLAGRDPALLLSMALAVFVELAQLAFGYGFGWEDVLDLANDGIGIALAICFHKTLLRFWPRLELDDSAPEQLPQGARSA